LLRHINAGIGYLPPAWAMNIMPAPPEIDATADAPPPAAKTRRPRWKLLVGAAGIVLLMAVWWWSRGPTITVVRVTRGNAAEIVYATGAVEPETWSRSTPLVRGRIVERCRCEGKVVKTGDLLARLDDKEAQATLNDLRAQEQFQRREFDRQEQLLARGVATSQSYQRAESDLARIRAQIAAQTQRLDYYRLVSPMDGTVLKEDGEVGDMVDPGTILYRVGLEKPLWVVADVNEEDIPRVKVGQKALLRTDAFAGQVLPGTVKQITPAGDPVSKTFRVRIGLPDDTPLRVGMSVEANIVSREKQDVLLAPANAVVNNSLLVVEGGRAHARKVEIGIRGSGFVEVVSGASDSDLVASPATTNIRTGSRVRPQLAEPAGP
jgi:RND family efflux transporter MFP subunit